MIRAETYTINDETLSMISELEEFKGKWKSLRKDIPKDLHKLKVLATIESIGSSNRIEGNKLSDSDVDILLSELKITSFSSRDEEEVAGYAYLLENIYDNYEVISLTENYIKQLHNMLLKYSSKDERHRGEYKKFPNNVVAFDSNGQSLGIVFETISPFETPEKMRELVNDFNTIIANKIIHPIIAISMFIVHFLQIHPFSDGNGRLSRVLTNFLLLKNGYDYILYSSLESIIEKSKAAYYKALRDTQTSFKDNYDYSAWTTFFIKALVKQKRHLEDKISYINSSDTFDSLDTSILDLFSKHQKLTLGEISKLLNRSPNTLKKRITNLCNKEKLIRYGNTKGAWYEKFKKQEYIIS